MSKIIDGKYYSELLSEHVKQEIEFYCKDLIKPKLVLIKIGFDKASDVYIKNKQKLCEQVGIESVILKYDNLSENELLDLIDELNDDCTVTGILVQLPLPENINTKRVLNRIDPDKDIDGFNPVNIGKLLQQSDGLRPCTPAGIIYMLDKLELDLTGMRAVVIGASNIVGRPMMLELINKGITPTLCNSKTKNLEDLVKQADIVIACLGKPKYVKGDWIKCGAIVIDVGIHRLDDGSLCGDVDYESAYNKASYITKVPGGVGPMTVAMLISNTWNAYKHIHEIKDFIPSKEYLESEIVTLPKDITDEKDILNFMLENGD